MSTEQRRVIADSLEQLVVQAYDFTKPDVAERIMSLYSDTGRVISASAGHIVTSRAALAVEVAGFWQRVGQNMQHPQFQIGSSYVDVLTANAVVMTFTYRIPHMTPAGVNHVVEGAWTALWRRQGGRWMIVQEHLSDTPQSTEAAPMPADTGAMPMPGHVMPPAEPPPGELPRAGRN